LGFPVKVRGCRGSVPVSGPAYHRYGGATTCFEIELADDHRLLVDAGTGALSIPSEQPGGPMTFSVLLTHLHWDHCLALPFFGPLYDPAHRFDFYGASVGHLDIEEAIDRVMRPPWFPVNFRSTAARKRFHHITSGDRIDIGGVSVTAVSLHHPDGVMGYRVEWMGATLVIATDVEHGVPESDARLLELAEGADVLIYDAQYLPDEYTARKVGWGHSTWREGVAVAEAAGVGALILTSHDPSRSDEAIDALVEEARSVFARTDAAVEGETVWVGARTEGV
jgi:phosphoribosyl 1,2-cyclic phosphodiesterase